MATLCQSRGDRERDLWQIAGSLARKEVDMLPVFVIASLLLPLVLIVVVLTEWIYRYVNEWRDALGTDVRAFESAGAALLGGLPWLPIPFFHPPALLTLALAAPGVWASLSALSSPSNQPLRGFYARILAVQLTGALWLVVLNSLLLSAHF